MQMGGQGEAMDFAEIWPKVKTRTLLDPFRAANLFKLVREALETHLEGEIVECGVYQGGSGLLLAMCAQAASPPRKVHLCDSFAGLPAAGPQDLHYSESMFDVTSESAVKSLVAAHGLGDVAVLHQGWLKDTLPSVVASRKFCFAHIDVDLYDAYKVSLEHIYDHMVDGGVLVFDDYFDQSPGGKAAIDEHLARTGELLYAGPTAQAYVYKGRKATADQKMLIPGLAAGVTCTIERLVADRAYMAFLEGQYLGFLERAVQHGLKMQRFHQDVVALAKGASAAPR
jgi:O-methyltransferase